MDMKQTTNTGKLFAVAHYILQNNTAMVSHLALQKLVYISFGVYTVRTGEYLFENIIEAWPYGPVIPDLYHRLKVYGSSTLSRDEFKKGEIEELKEEEKKSINEVLAVYGGRRASDLILHTHLSGSAWDTTYQNVEQANEIPKERIKDWYGRLFEAVNYMKSEPFKKVMRELADT